MAKRYLGGGVSFEQKDVYQEFSEEEGGGGGSTTLSGLTDVDISEPTNGQTLVYNATSGKWENGAGGGSALVVNVTEDGNNLVLDRTYAEIVSAAPLVCLGAVDANHSEFKWLTAFGAMQGSYAVMFGNSQDDMFSTDTENGYPSQAGSQ